MMRKGRALVISAPSGTGKSTLCHMLLDEFHGLSFSISCTTRKPRAGEIDGKDYYFLNEEKFLSVRNSGGFAEWAIVHGNFYGTPIKPLQNQLHKGQDVLLDVDVQGASQIRVNMPRAFFVFIVPPSIEELKRRLLFRGTDSEASINKRLANVTGEIRQASWYDAILVNDDLEKAYEHLRAIYISATLTPALNPHLLNSLLSESMEIDFDRADNRPRYRP